MNEAPDLDDQSADLPIVDCAYYDERREAYVVTFVPTDEVSAEPTETVFVHQNAPEFHRLNTLFWQLNQLVAPEDFVERIVHTSGQTFTVHLRGGQSLTVITSQGDEFPGTHERLKLIAELAQGSFHSTHVA